MKTKIAGMMILLAGTATVFAATHKSLNDETQQRISGVAGIIQGLDKAMTVELEVVGLDSDTQYIARLESSACESLPSKPSAAPGRLFVATYLESNQFGALRTIFKGLPEYARDAKAVALYSERGIQDNVEMKNVYCVNLG